jgi:hypothetical protein
VKTDSQNKKAQSDINSQKNAFTIWKSLSSPFTDSDPVLERLKG